MDPEEHLRLALGHAESAVEGFPDGSKEESVADNAMRWIRKAVQIVERERDE